MDTSSVISAVESALTDQLSLAGDDASVYVAAEALLAALGPALSNAALALGEQAAMEARAQLPDHDVDVVLLEGNPNLVIRSSEPEVTFSTDEFEARLTLRLPKDLKSEIEHEAGLAGESVNSYVVKALSRPRSGRKAKRITGRFTT